MSEHEKDPQRPPASADAEPSHPTAELPRVERGDSGSEHPSPQAAPQPQASNSGGQDPTATTAPAGAETSPAAGQPAAGAQPTAGQAAGAVPGTGVGHQAGPWQAGYAPAQGHWAGGPGYPSQPHAAGPPPQPYGVGLPPHGGGTVPPAWAQGPGYGGPGRPPRRVGRLVAAGAVVLALMTGSGVAGGVVALAVNPFADDGGRVFNAAPVINRADLPKIAAAVQNSVVSINTGDGEGSGVVLTADGYVLTNNHVVASASGDTVKVVFADGKTVDARIVGTDPKTDLAVVKASGVSDLIPAKFGDSDAMQVGDTVLALGSPLGLQGSVTSGIVSARDRTIQAGDGNQNPFQRSQGAASISGLLQTDAPINPGNSGGALVNTNGEVIGINTAIATSGQGSGNIGVGFAIPSNKAEAVADALRGGQKVSHPTLGVSVGTAENGGALVNSVTAGSPAEKAGLQQGDVITKFAGKRINEPNDLVAAVQGGKVGDQVELAYTRNGAEKTATVTLAEAS